MANKRTQDRISRNLGIIQGGRKTPRSRTETLEKIDQYLKGTQYDGLTPWDEAEKNEQDYIPIKKRKPQIIFPFAKLFCERLSAKLLGRSVFPKFKIEEDPDTEELLKTIIKLSDFKSKMLTASKQFCSHGTTFVRFKISGGSPVIESFNPKWVFPKFDANGKLISARVQYVFKDENDLDEKSKPIEKWFRMDLTQTQDILYDTPEFKSDEEPEFKIVKTANHNLGFVQGEWIRTEEIKFMSDGVGIVEPIFDFIDSLNYNLSQSDRAVSYALDPQLITKGMDQEEVDSLIKSSLKGWNLGREGEANFLEIEGSGIERAQETRGDFSKNMQDISRIILLDPEKLVAHAQSAKAMEVLHGPMIELVDELRPQLEKGMIALLQKMLATIIILNKRGEPLSIIIPPQFTPKSFNIEAIWGEIFQKTVQDLKDKASLMISLTTANILSRETALARLAKDFDIEDIEAEIQRINTQPQFQTFGF